MNRLRVYIHGEKVETSGGHQVFYSRREDGPYYQWKYDETSRVWQAGRVLRSGASPKMLTAATWNKVPAGLQRRITEHYED